MLKNVPKNGLIMEKIYTPLLNIFQPRWKNDHWNLVDYLPLITFKSYVALFLF
jgi:hypothetical protein